MHCIIIKAKIILKVGVSFEKVKQRLQFYGQHGRGI
jgi:hypothetical protein